jgi:hypothetical protein
MRTVIFINNGPENGQYGMTLTRQLHAEHERLSQRHNSYLDYFTRRTDRDR